MEEHYSKWKKALDDFKASVDKDVQEIRQYKAQMQKMRQEGVSFCNGNYMRDNKRFIISAPEIIIGDVDMNGTLNGSGASTVVIRANKVMQEGVTTMYGSQGTIMHRAPVIKNICEDPGLDGLEATVDTSSEFSVQAHGIGLLAESTPGMFVDHPVSSFIGSVNIKADERVNISATVPCKERKTLIDDILSKKKEKLSDVKQAAEKQKKQVEDTMDQLKEYLGSGKPLYATDDAVRGGYLDLEDISELVNETAHSLGLALDECTAAISRLAELNRQLKSLAKAKEDIGKYEAKYKTESTGAQVNIMTEATRIVSADADGNLRDNDGAGLYVVGRDITFSARDKEGATMEKSNFNITAHDINLSTANPKIEEKTSDLPTTGNVRITSKNITLESVDYEVKDNEKPTEVTEKALTKDGALNIRVENIGITSYGTDGKAGGKFDLNSKDITLRAVDMKVDDKGKASDDKLAEGSKVTLIASDIAAGGIDKDKQAKSVKIAFAEEISADAKTKIELKQDEGKDASVQLTGNNVEIKGKEAKVSGKTTIDGETAIKAKTEIGGNVSVSGTIDTRNSKSL